MDSWYPVIKKGGNAMSVPRSSHSPVWLGVFAVVSLTLLAGSVASAYDYHAIAIPPLPGKERSFALGINNQGQVVGRSYNFNPGTGTAEDRQAFLWDRANGVRGLATLSGESVAWGINQAGSASGYSFDSGGQQRAAWWNVSTNQITDIGTLTGPSSTAYGINASGAVVGNADIPTSDPSFTPFHAFLYTTANGIQDLGTLTTAWPEYQNGFSIAYDINTQGEVVGIANDASFAYLPFLYDTTNGMRVLPRDPNHLEATKEWYAVAINDAGVIGGHVIVATNQSLPYYWPIASATPLAIQMPAGFPYGEIYGINSSGQMVGVMWDSDGAGAVEHGFIFDPVKGVRDLNDLIPAQSGWLLTYARDINDQGQIVGLGDLNGEKRGFVLTPAPPAASAVGLFRPSDGTFYLDYNGNGVWEGCGVDRCLSIGMNGDIPLVGDWNGSGTSKVGAFRPSDGTFYLDYNGSGTWEGCGTDRCLQIGLNGDIPLVGDWDGTGSSKVGAFRPSDGTFYLDYNGNGVWDGCGTDRCLQIGLNGDIPLVGDWDGTGSSKVGAFRPSDGTFYLDYNGSGTWEGCGTDRCLQIGLNGDIPLVGDWNLTSTSKVGAFRPSDGTFYLDYNGSGTWEGCGTDRCLSIGLNGDEPLVGKW
jgi:probable HAF family extracellular repeat protein